MSTQTVQLGVPHVALSRTVQRYRSARQTGSDPLYWADQLAQEVEGLLSKEGYYVQRWNVGSANGPHDTEWSGPYSTRHFAETVAGNGNPEGWNSIVHPSTAAIRAEIWEWERGVAAQRVAEDAEPPVPVAVPASRAAGRCPCACATGGFCGGCGHAGCGRR